MNIPQPPEQPTFCISFDLSCPQDQINHPGEEGTPAALLPDGHPMKLTHHGTLKQRNIFFTAMEEVLIGEYGYSHLEKSMYRKICTRGQCFTDAMVGLRLNPRTNWLPFVCHALHISRLESPNSLYPEELGNEEEEDNDDDDDDDDQEEEDDDQEEEDDDE